MKKIFKFIRGLKGVLAGFMTSNRKDSRKEAAELSKLLSFETISAKTFYRIQKELAEIVQRQKNLKESQNPQEEIQSLNEKWLKAMNLLGKASPKILQKRWQEITERYYREVDESSFEIFLKDLRKDVKWDAELLIMLSAFELVKLGDEEAIDILANMGIKGDIKKIHQKIQGKITNHELKQKPKEDAKPVDFFVMLAKVRKEGYEVKSDILLQEWIGILKDIKESNERNNSKE